MTDLDPDAHVRCELCHLLTTVIESTTRAMHQGRCASCGGRLVPHTPERMPDPPTRGPMTATGLPVPAPVVEESPIIEAVPEVAPEPESAPVPPSVRKSKFKQSSYVKCLDCGESVPIGQSCPSCGLGE